MFQSLGLVEFSAHEIQQRFDELDNDHDGYLNEREVRALVRKWLAPELDLRRHR